jgi:hypothetical protein
MKTLGLQLDGYNFNLAYDYDVFGRRTGITYPNRAQPVSYNYNELDRLQSIPGFVSSCSYDGDNKLTDMLFGNGINNHYDYRTNDDKLADIQVGPSGSLLSLNYTYDVVGNIKQINNDYYRYDGLNRLVWAGDSLTSRTGNGTAWTYDEAGLFNFKKRINISILKEFISFFWPNFFETKEGLVLVGEKRQQDSAEQVNIKSMNFKMDRTSIEAFHLTFRTLQQQKTPILL